MVFAVDTSCGAKHNGIRVSPLCWTDSPRKNRLSKRDAEAMRRNQLGIMRTRVRRPYMQEQLASHQLHVTCVIGRRNAACAPRRAGWSPSTFIWRAEKAEAAKSITKETPNSLTLCRQKNGETEGPGHHGNEQQTQTNLLGLTMIPSDICSLLKPITSCPLKLFLRTLCQENSLCLKEDMTSLARMLSQLKAGSKSMRTNLLWKNPDAKDYSICL